MKADLRPHAIGLIAALIVQYAIGMYIDLFVSFPEGASESQMWDFAWSQWSVTSHILLAVLILIGAIALSIRAAQRREKIWLWASGVGLLAVFAAGFSGGSFIPSQNDIYSYSMAIAFIIAIVAYAWGVYESRRIVA